MQGFTIRFRNRKKKITAGLLMLVLFCCLSAIIIFSTISAPAWAMMMPRENIRQGSSHHDVVPTKEFHAPPVPMSSNISYYDNNPTPFGGILRGKLPAACLAETSTLLAFCDRAPRAKFHALIIPKRWIRTVQDLTTSDLPLLYEMKQMADDLITTAAGPAKETNAHHLAVFHVPPFHSVDHLHLHVLDRGSVDWLGRLKYAPETRYCTEFQTVIDRLERNEPPTPFTNCDKSRVECLFGTLVCFYSISCFVKVRSVLTCDCFIFNDNFLLCCSLWYRGLAGFQTCSSRSAGDD